MSFSSQPKNTSDWANIINGKDGWFDEVDYMDCASVVTFRYDNVMNSNHVLKQVYSLYEMIIDDFLRVHIGVAKLQVGKSLAITRKWFGLKLLTSVVRLLATTTITMDILSHPGSLINSFTSAITVLGEILRTNRSTKWITRHLILPIAQINTKKSGS